MASRALRCIFSTGVMATAKKNGRLLDQRVALPGWEFGQQLGHQDLFMELGQIQRLQSGGQSQASQSPRRIQARLPPLLQVRPQRRLIAARQVQDLSFHAFRNSRAACRTDRADLHESLRAGDFIL